MKYPLITLGVVMISTLALAQIYKWVDEEGNVHYSDEPPEHAEPQELELAPGPSEAAVREAQSRVGEQIRQSEADRTARAEAQRTTETSRDAAALRQSMGEQACRQARTRLAILSEQLPVYRDQFDNLHVVWARGIRSEYDFYVGPRQFLDDATRELEARQARESIAQNCQNADDPDAQAAAHADWIRSEDCLASRRRLILLEREESRATQSELNRVRADVNRYCD